MTIIDFVRLISKHLILLIIVPLLLASMVILLTMNPTLEYSSQTTLYTGLASGSSIEMDKSFNYQATNTALIT
jgi:capsular polysaccharide biosynthesis protein